MCTKRSVLDPLFFLIYISDLLQSLHVNKKLFADHTSLLLVIDDIDEWASNLNDDLMRTQEWPYQWKIYFNPARIKPVHEVLFTRKGKNFFTLICTLTMCQLFKQKHLGLQWLSLLDNFI